MFDIGFWELALIGVVALLVIGPDRLPGVARAAGVWFGKARRFISSVKADVEREIRAEELKRIMQEQARSSGIHEIIEETQADIQKSREELTTAKEALADDLGEDAPGAGKTTSESAPSEKSPPRE